MRYNLRTLLITVGILGAVFARIGYTSRMAAIHRTRAAIAIQRMSASTGESPELVADWLAPYARYDSQFRVNPWGNPWDMETDDLAKDLKDAVYHTAMANAYERYLLLPFPRITIEPVSSPAALKARSLPPDLMRSSDKLPAYALP